MPGSMMRDPLTNQNALGYSLPDAVQAADGDIEVREQGFASSSVSDLIRFKNNKIFIYSRNSASLQDEANPPVSDTLQLPSYTAGKRVTEVGTDSNNGIGYTPTNGQPGLSANFEIELMFKSDGNGGPAFKEPMPDAGSMGNSVTYNGSSGKLSFADDHITDTGFADAAVGPDNDSMLGAAVNVPECSLTGSVGAGIFAFKSAPGAVFSITNGSDVFFQAHLPNLTYSAVDNTFTGQLTDLDFKVGQGLGSPWITLGDYVFSPPSGEFDPNRKLLFKYTPQQNMLGLTDSFLQSGTSAGTNLLTPTPEPAMLIVFSLGIAMLIGFRGKFNQLVRKSLDG
jgi:hypothetical protein